MRQAVRQPEPLWPSGAPGARAQGTADRPTVTPYLTRTTRPHGALVVCPGGAYAFKAPQEGVPIARWLNSLGISAFVLDYRVAPYRSPYPYLDACRALRYVRYHAPAWHIDPQRIGIIGFSAGGHLAASVATRFDLGAPGTDDEIDRISCRPDVVVLCYPVISFGTYGHQESMTNLLGADMSDEPRLRLSAEQYVSPRTPPAFLWHTADDAEVPVDHSLLFAGALRRQGVPFELHVFGSGAHGAGLAGNEAEVATWTDLCAAWLARRGFGRGSRGRIPSTLWRRTVQTARRGRTLWRRLAESRK